MCLSTNTHVLFTNPSLGLSHPGVVLLLQEVILPAFRLAASLRTQAVECLGLFCMLNKDIAEQHLPVRLSPLSSLLSNIF